MLAITRVICAWLTDEARMRNSTHGRPSHMVTKCYGARTITTNFVVVQPVTFMFPTMLQTICQLKKKFLFRSTILEHGRQRSS